MDLKDRCLGGLSQTRFGSSTISSTKSSTIHGDSPRSFRRSTDRSNSSEQRAHSSRMDSVNFNALDQRFITGLYLKEALSRDRSKNLGKHFIVRSMPGCSVTVIRRNWTTQKQKFCIKEQLLNKGKFPPMKLQETASPERARRNPMPERATTRWSPNIHHRF